MSRFRPGHARARARAWRAALLLGLLAARTPAHPVQDREYEDVLAELQTALERVRSPDAGVMTSASEALYDLATELDDELRAAQEEDPAAVSELMSAYVALALLPAGPFSSDTEAAAVLDQAREFLSTYEGAGADYWRANLEYTAGVRWMDRGVAQQAEQAFAAARELARREPAMMGMILAAHADVLRKDDRWNEALGLLQQADHEWEALPEAQRRSHAAMVGRCDVLGVRGQVYVNLGLADVAVPWYREEERCARQVFDRYDNPAPRQAAAARRGSLYLLVSQPQAALHEIAPALADPDLDPSLSARLHAIEAKALTRMSLEDGAGVEQAAAALRATIALPDLTGIDRLHVELEHVRLDLRTGALDRAEEWLERLQEATAHREGELDPTRERAGLAALAARLARMRGADRDQLRVHQLALRTHYTHFLDEWRASPIRPGGLNFLLDDTRRELLAELIELTLALEPEHPEAALQRLIEAQAMSTLARSVGAAPVLSPRLLDEDTGLLTYLPTWERTYVFAVDHRGVVYEPGAGWAELGPLVAALNEAVRLRRPATDITAAAAPLSSRLFPGEVNARVRTWRSIQVVQPDLIHNPPFECLGPAAHPLGIERAVSYLPSVPLGSWMLGRQANAAPARCDLLLVAAPEHSPEAARLWPDLATIPWTDAGRRRLLGPFRDAHVFAAGTASWSALQQASLLRPRILHVLCHGVYAPRLHQLGGLLLSPSGADDDGVLWAERLSSLDLSGLVILSACGAARGPERLGEGGFENLGGALLQAGAPAVVLATGDVDYDTTLTLMESLHLHLKEGHTVAEALRRARTDLPRADGGLSADAVQFRVLGLGQTRAFDD